MSNYDPYEPRNIAGNKSPADAQAINCMVYV